MLDHEQRSLDPVVESVPTPTAPAAGGGYAPAASLLERAYLFLENGEFARADEYCEKVLDLEPRNAHAYLGKMLAQLRLRKPQDLQNLLEPFDSNYYLQSVLRFADPALQAEINGYRNQICNRKYHAALEILETNTSPMALKGAEAAFRSLGAYSDSAAKAELCRQQAEFCAIDERYVQAKNAAELAQTPNDYALVAGMFHNILQHKDSAQLAELYGTRAEEMAKEEIYANGLRLQENRSYSDAIQAFSRIPGYEDADQRRADCKQAQKLRNKKWLLRGILALVAAIILAAGSALIVMLVKKHEAEEIRKAAEAAEAADAEAYSAAEALIEESPAQAAIAFYALGDYKDARERSLTLWDQVAVRDTIAAGDLHTVGLNSDGIVVAIGSNRSGQCDVSDWTDIVAISAGGYHTVGLKADGTVVAVGHNASAQCNVSGWTDIVAISAGGYHTVGLKADGTVVAVGNNGGARCNVSGWTDIVAISAGGYHTVGLKADGTVVATGKNEDGQCNVSDWTNIVAISAGSFHTVGLKADGTVVAVGNNGGAQCNVSGWTDIVAISAGGSHTVGLKTDGSVVAVGSNGSNQCDAESWKNIVAISAGGYHTVGLKAARTVITTGSNNENQCNVYALLNIKLPNK